MSTLSDKQKKEDDAKVRKHELKCDFCGELATGFFEETSLVICDSPKCYKEAKDWDERF